MFIEITSLQQFNDITNIELACLFYFSHEECNVCKVLKPKVDNLITKYFPKINLYYVNTQLYPEIAAQNSIFTNPTILIFFEDKEFIRKSRNIGIDELKSLIERPYNLMF